MEKVTVLYVSIDSSMGGSTASLYNLIDGISDRVSPVVLFPEFGPGYDWFTEHGIECYVYPFVKLYQFKRNHFRDVWNRPWRWHRIKKVRMDLKCALYMKKKLRGRKVSIVHSNTSPSDIGVFLAWLFGAKHIWHVRECLDLHMNAEIYGGMPRLIAEINKADARIAVSSFVASHWQMKPESTYVIYDAARSISEATYNSGKDKFVLFSSYYITEQKGSRIAVEAFGNSHLSDEGFDLLFVGNCKEEYRQSLLETAARFDCYDNIKFIPCQRDVKPFFEKASVFLMSSKAEGLSRVVSEAMFFGCPVLASSESGGALDQVIDGETGFVFHSIEECAALLRKICLNDNESIILRASSFAKEFLSNEVYSMKIRNVYGRLLNFDFK